MKPKEEIFNLLKRLDIEAADELVDRLERYVELWSRWNERVRLTSRMSTDEFIGTQLAESLLLWRLFGERGSYLDVGSGGGLPGIPIALLLRDRTVLVESNYRKAAFLNACRRELGIGWVRVHCGRVEEIDDLASLAPFRYITARAVAPIASILKWTIDLADDRTTYIIPKGDKAGGELDAAQELMERLGLSARIEKLTSPLKPYPYRVVVLERKR